MACRIAATATNCLLQFGRRFSVYAISTSSPAPALSAGAAEVKRNTLQPRLVVSGHVRHLIRLNNMTNGVQYAHELVIELQKSC